MDITLHGGSVGQPRMGTSTGEFVMCFKGPLGVQRLSLWEFCEGNLEWGLPYWGP
jgi:hypothetical protein